MAVFEGDDDMALDPPENTVLLGLACFFGGMILAPSLGPILAAIAIIGGLAYATSGVIDALSIYAQGRPAARAEPKIGNNPRRVSNQAVDADPRVGDHMPDGTIYAGVSPDTGKALYTMPADASLTMAFNEAKQYATKLDACGHQDWRVPTTAELNVLFNNRAAIGGFNVTGSSPAGWYWSSSSVFKWGAWGQRFSDGCQYNDHGKDNHSSVRCVR